MKKNPTQRIIFFNLLRCVAAVAVVTIHALAPYRHQLGDIPFAQWGTAVTINGLSRWAVPVFILITGALLLSDQRAISWGYYIKRRIGKVLIPFLAWSLFYACLSGWDDNGFEAQKVISKLTQSATHETYYHLGFFYYFIPLYFVIPFFHFLIRQGQERVLYAWLAFWLLTTALYLFFIDGWWSNSLWLYSGYLVLGYVLYQKVPLTNSRLMWFLVGGVTGLIASAGMVLWLSVEAGQYTVGRWLSYKTVNTVAAAAMIFVLCQPLAERFSRKMQTGVCWLSRYSLGIYLIHPLFLWPMNTFHLYHGHPLWVIPLWVLISGSGALLISWLLSLSNKTRWLVP